MFNEQIKSVTKQAHLDLEKSVIRDIKNIRSKADYAALLEKFHTYFNLLEQKITPFIDETVLPDFKERRKSANLEEDLQVLGKAARPAAPNIDLPVISNTAQALGALYVIEGSTMGGSIIVKMLQEKCGIEEGLSFFSGYGANTPPMWQTFTRELNRNMNSTQDEELAIQAADETFRKFSNLFAQHG